MVSLIKLIKKNFKILLRSKTSALIVIFGPLLIIFLMGLAFNNANPFSINIGVYSEAFNNQTEQFIGAFEAENISVSKFTEINDCIEKIKDNDIHACIELPTVFEAENEQKVEITYHVDSSNLILVDTIGSLLTKAILDQSSQQSLSLTNVLLSKLDETKSVINTQQERLESLKQANDELKANISELISNLESMDTDFNPDAFNVSGVKTKASRVINKARKAVTESERLMTDIENNADDWNISSEGEDDLEVLFNRTHVYLNELTSELSSSGGTTLTTMLDMFDNNLDDVQDQFGNIDTQKQTIINNLKALQNSLDALNTQITDVQNGFTSLKKSIEQIKITSADVIVSPFTTNVDQIAAKDTYLKKKMPSIIVLVVMFIGILLATTLVMIEKKSPAHFRNYVVPTRDITFIAATFLTCFIIISLQLAIILGVSVAAFNLNFLNNWFNICIVLLITSSLFILLGMLIGYLFNSQETAILASVSVGSLLFLLSDLLIPIESMPIYFYNFVKAYNPFIVCSEILKKSIIFSPPTPLLAMWKDILMLIAYAVVIFILLLITHKLMRKNYFGKWQIKMAIKQRRKRAKSKKYEIKMKKKEEKLNKKKEKKDSKDSRTKAGKKAKAEKAHDDYDKHSSRLKLGKK